MQFRSLPFIQAILLLPALLAPAQQQPGEIEHGTFLPTSLTMSASSSPGLRVDTANSNFGDHWVSLNEPSPATTGVMMASIVEDLAGVGTPSINLVSGTQYTLANQKAGANQGEYNQNTAMAWFPYSHFLGGASSNTTNNGPVTGLVASAGIDLGEEFVDNGDGTYTVDLRGLGASSESGILLVTAVSNENNYALSHAKVDGTFTIFCHDNNANAAIYERDPVAFVYVPVTHTSPQIVAMGRVAGEVANLVNPLHAGPIRVGDYEVIKSSDTGIWHLSIPGHSPNTGTLIISPEGGGEYNPDNIWSYEWDHVAGHWVIRSRDLVGLGLQNVNVEPAFSFVFLQNPPIHVDASAPANGDGMTWATAYQDLQSALAAAHDGDQIWVAEGTYKPGTTLTDSFILPNGVEVYGGFPTGGGDGSFLARDSNPATNGTILSGDLNEDDQPNFGSNADNSYHVVRSINSDSSTRLDGFTVRGGHARHVQDVSLDVGGGILLEDAGPILINLILEDNEAAQGGGMGFYRRNTPTSRPVRLINVIVRNNMARRDGGGLFYIWGADAILTNVILSGNTANRGGGMFPFNTRTTLYNCTIADNHADLRGGGGSGSNMEMYNTIIWGNTAPEFPGVSEFVISPRSKNNLSQDDVGALDPQFADSDYNLALTSPAIDAGDAAVVDIDDYDVDMDGNTVEVTPVDVSGFWRLNGLAVDMGARESNPLLSNLDRTVLTESWEVGIDEGGITGFLPNGWISGNTDVAELIWRPGAGAIGSRFDEAEPLTYPAHGSNTLYLRANASVYKVTDVVLEAGKTYTLSAAVGEDRALDSTGWSMALFADRDDSGELSNASFLAEEDWQSATAVLPEEGQWKRNEVRFSGSSAEPQDLGKRLIIRLEQEESATAYFDNVRLEVTGDADIHSTSPTVGGIDVIVSDPIVVNFATDLNANTINGQSVLVNGSVSGPISGSIDVSGSQLTFTPDQPFAEGETITLQLGDQARTMSGATVDSPPIHFQTKLPASLEALARDNISRGESTAGNSVDTFSGAFNLSFSPVVIDGVRTLSFPISYNSLFTGLTSTLGYGWSHAYEARLAGDPHGIMTVLWDASRRNRFDFAGPGQRYTPLEEAVQYADLVRRSDGYWWLTLQDGTVYEFGATGRLERVGNKVFQWLEMHYADGKLNRIVEPISDKSLTLHYDENHSLIGLSDDLDREVFFLYDDRGRLTAVTDPLLYGEAIITGSPGLKSIPDNSANGLEYDMAFDGDGTVGRLRVEEGSFIHSRISDLRITLTSPSGRSAVIHDLEAHNSEFGGMIIDDFDGEPVRGTWRLTAQDLVAGISGQLSKWEMRFTASTNASHYTYEEGTFPKAGRLIQAEDVLGDRLFANTYDATGRVLTQDDGLDSNQLGQFEYTSTGGGAQDTRYWDRLGNLYRYEHDAEGHLTAATDPVGSRVSMEYNARGDRTRSVDPLGFETRFEYDATGNLTKVIEHGGREIPFEYDDRRNVTQIFENAPRTKLAYDSLNNAIKLIQPSGDFAENDYDASSQLCELVDFRFEESTNEFEESIRIGWAGTIGKRRTITLPEGGEIVYLYDALGRVVSTTNAGGDTTTRTYTQTGKLATETDPLGNVTRKCFDHRDRLVVEIDKKGNRKEYRYDGNDNVIARINAIGETTELLHDGEDRSIGSIDPAGNTRRQVLDASGQVVETQDPSGRKTYFLYDIGGREIKRYADDGTLLLETAYDAFGNIASETDGNGVVTSFSYTDLREPKSVYVGGELYSGTTSIDAGQQPKEGPGGQRKLAGDRLKKLVNKRGVETSFEYDSQGRVTSVETFAQAGSSDVLSVYYTYDDRDLIIKEESSSDRDIDYAYDELGRLVEVTPSVGSGKVYTYDVNGNVLTSSKKTGGVVSETISREVDELDRLIRYTDADGNTLQFQYNALGAVSLIVYPDNKTVQYTYDTSGRLTTVTDWANRQTQYHYDQNGRLHLIELPNGTRREMAFNAAGQITERVDLDASDQMIVGYDYRHDHPLKIAQEVPRHQEAPYIPDNLSMTYDDADRLATVDGQPVGFDLDGNMTNAPFGVGAMTYNYANNLLSAGSYTYQYDAEDHLVGWKTGSQQTKFVVNPANGFAQILVKKNPNGTTTNYVYGIGLIYQETSGTTKTFHYDHRGSTIALSNPSGQVSGRVTYGPFGEIVDRQNDTDTIFLFNGLYGVATSPQDFVHMRFRWYWPAIKRFINRDAHVGDIFVADSMNRYAYGGNNPVSRIDPSGEFYHILAGAIGGAVVGVAAEFVVDLVDGGGLTSTWEDYASAAIGGAVTGTILAINPGLVAVAGGAGGFAESLSGSLFRGEDVSFWQLAGDTAAGAAFGKFGHAAGKRVGSKLGKKVSQRVFGKSITAAKRGGRRGFRQMADADLAVKLLTSRSKALSAGFEFGTGFVAEVFGEAVGERLVANILAVEQREPQFGTGKESIIRQAFYEPQSRVQRRYGAQILWRTYTEALQLAGRPVPSHPNNTISNF